MGVINKSTAEINTLLDKVESMPEEGIVGKTPVLETGSTTTLDPGQNATSEVVSNGTDSSGNPKYKINFGIPRGYDGSGTGGGGVAEYIQWGNVLNKPTWVNSSTKPTYTATEVGALPATTTIPSKTSQLTNDSNYVTSSTLKTINGQSIVGTGNIEISGAGSGIADAPSDGQIYGRKNGNWSAITGGTGGSVDISDIMQRIVQLSEIEGTCTDEDYNALKGYADSGIITYINVEGTSMIVHVKNLDGVIQALYVVNNVQLASVAIFIIDTSKKVSVANNIFYTIDNYGSGLLGSYSKPSSYSAITKDDTISAAIGKLEAGLGTSGGGSSSDDIYYLSSELLNLDNQATSEDIYSALGGEDKKEELKEAIGNGKKIYISGGITYAPTPVTCYNLYGVSIYISFIKYNYKESEIVNITITTFSNIKIIFNDGFGLNSSFYSLTSYSSNEDISSSIGGESGMKKLIKAIEDGNRIYIKSSTDLQQRTDLLCNTYAKSDNGDMSVIFFGFGYGLWGQIGGYIQIQYTKSSNTFSAKASGLS